MRSVWFKAVVCCLTVWLSAGVALPQQQPQFESLLASAQEAQARRDFEAAANYYRQAVTLQPEVPELRANVGLMYYQIGKHEQAIEAFHQALRLKPRLFVPNLFLGLEYVRLKQFHEAIPYLKRATLLNSQDVQTWLALGQAYAATGQTRLTMASYSRAAELDPGNADGWYRLGVSYLEQVEADARVLLARHKDSAYLEALAAETFVQQRKFIQAGAAYKTVLSSPTFPPDSHAGYGFVLLNLQRFADAEREFNAELAITPGSLAAKLGLARLLIEQDAARDGVKQLQGIWSTEPGFVQSNIWLLKSGLPPPSRSRLDQALDELQTAGDVSQQFVAVLRSDAKDERAIDTPQQSSSPAATAAPPTHAPLQEASEFYTNGRYRECRESLRSRLSALGTNDLQVLAACAYSTGDYTTSVEAAQKLALHPDTEAAGLYWEIRSAQKLATRALLRASEIDSTSPQLHVLLGDVYREKMYFPDAEREYRKALDLRPQDSGALYGLCLAMLADSEIDQAFGLTQSILKRHPDDPELNALMGEILCARQDYTGAEAYLKKALNTKPELVRHVHALLGKVYAKTNRTQQAIDELKLALSDDKDGRLHYQIARLYLKVGDRDAATQAFEVSDRMRREGLTRAAVALQQGQDDIDSQ